MDRAFSPYEHWGHFPGAMAQAGMRSRLWRCACGTFLQVVDGMDQLSGKGRTLNSRTFLRRNPPAPFHLSHFEVLDLFSFLSF